MHSWVVFGSARLKWRALNSNIAVEFGPFSLDRRLYRDS
jgi:hypothetical protein